MSSVQYVANVKIVFTHDTFRKCPGRYFAANGALITIATILAALDISSKETELMKQDMGPRVLMTADAMSCVYNRNKNAFDG